MAHPHAPPPPLPQHIQSPTTLSLVVATAIISSLAGYFLGQASSLGIFSSSPSPRRSTTTSRKARNRPQNGESRDIKTTSGGVLETDSESDPSSEDGSDDEDFQVNSGALKTFADSSEDFKMTLILRTDLGMTKGKLAAQAAHAALLNYTTLESSLGSSKSISLASTQTHPAIRKWQRCGQAKIALQVSSVDELEAIRVKAAEAGLCAGVIRDAGRTQVESGSVTALAVGPGPRGVVDGVSGGLRLL